MKALIYILTISLAITILQLQQINTQRYRLGAHIYPLFYDISITPDFADKNLYMNEFHARTIIYVKTRQQITGFALHSDNLTYSSVKMYRPDDQNLSQPLSIGAPFVDQNTTQLLFEIPKGRELEPGKEYKIVLDYSGPITDTYDGFFMRYYYTQRWEKKWILVTNLLGANARKLFPCFDEPLLQTVFNLNVEHPPRYNLLSNTYSDATYASATALDSQLTRMSTFMLTFIVSEFERRGYDSLFIYTKPEHVNNTDFSYGMARQIRKSLDFLVQAPTLGKILIMEIHLVAVPRHGYSGGAGNFGVITFDSTILVYEDKDEAGVEDTQLTAKMLTRELTHTSFRNHVKIEWWNYYWLCDGFATYFEYFQTHKTFPEYELDRQFVVDQLHAAFDEDFVQDSPPITVHHVYSSSDIANVVNGNILITAKGAAVIRMLYHGMKEKKFNEMVQAYIYRHYQGVITAPYLLQVVKTYYPKYPHINLDQFFECWTEKSGYPMLTVTLAENNCSVKLTHTRYANYYDPHTLYTIPLTYTTNIEGNFENTYPIRYFENNERQVNIFFPEPVNWVMFNIQQTGYYRVMYDETVWESLREALIQRNFSGIHVINRAQYVDDLLSYGECNRIAYDKVFYWLEYLKNETHYIPWKAALKGFKSIESRMEDKDQKAFGKFILFVTNKVYNKLGFHVRANDTILDRLLRRKIVSINCRYGRKDCNTQARVMFEAFLYNGTKIPVDMRYTIYCAGIRDRNFADYMRLYTKYMDEKRPRERLRVQNALGCVRHSDNVKHYFELITDYQIRNEKRINALKPLLEENPDNAWTVYKMATETYKQLLTNFKDPVLTATFIKEIAAYLKTRDEMVGFKTFKEKVGPEFGPAKSILDEAYLLVDENWKWSQDSLIRLRDYLEHKNWEHNDFPVIIEMKEEVYENTDHYYLIFFPVLPLFTWPMLPRRVDERECKRAINSNMIKTKSYRMRVV